MRAARLARNFALLAGCLSAATVPPPAVDLPPTPAGKVATMVVAGGQFWGPEAIFEELKGVIAVVAGYTGGKAEDANFDAVAAGRTKHAEAVQITYDPSQITYGKLLQIFFAVVHDPTQMGRQGPDVGPQFRSAIFCSSDAQKKVAQAYIAQINRARVFRDPIVTEVSTLQGFFTAEAHQQHYVQRNPADPYVVANIEPKLTTLMNQFPDLLK